jgi:mono/diheme cytochrome c family protein
MIVPIRRLKIREFKKIVCLVLFSSITGGLLLAAQSPASEGATSSAYKANCAICHAEDGSGTPLGIRLHAKDLRSKEVQAKSSEELAQTVRAGKDNMPAFGNRIDSEQIDKLVQYVRTKKPKGH